MIKTTEFRILTGGRIQALPPQVQADLRGMMLPWLAELATLAHTVHPMPWLQELPRFGLVLNVVATRWVPGRTVEICWQVASVADPAKPATTQNGHREEVVLCAWGPPATPIPRAPDLLRWAEVDHATGFPMRWAGIPLGPGEREKARLEAKARGEHGPGYVPKPGVRRGEYGRDVTRRTGEPPGA